MPASTHHGQSSARGRQMQQERLQEATTGSPGWWECRGASTARLSPGLARRSKNSLKL